MTNNNILLGTIAVYGLSIERRSEYVKSLQRGLATSKSAAGYPNRISCTNDRNDQLSNQRQTSLELKYQIFSNFPCADSYNCELNVQRVRTQDRNMNKPTMNEAVHTAQPHGTAVTFSVTAGAVQTAKIQPATGGDSALNCRSVHSDL